MWGCKISTCDTMWYHETTLFVKCHMRNHVQVEFHMWNNVQMCFWNTSHEILRGFEYRTQVAPVWGVCPWWIVIAFVLDMWSVLKTQQMTCEMSHGKFSKTTCVFPCLCVIGVCVYEWMLDMLTESQSHSCNLGMVVLGYKLGGPIICIPLGLLQLTLTLAAISYLQVRLSSNFSIANLHQIYLHTPVINLI